MSHSPIGLCLSGPFVKPINCSMILHVYHCIYVGGCGANSLSPFDWWSVLAVLIHICTCIISLEGYICLEIFSE